MIGQWISRLLGGDRHTGKDASLVESARIANGAAAASMIVDCVEALEGELARARRYEHALSIVVLAARPSSAAIEGMLPQVVSLLAAAALRDVLRQSDIVCYQPTVDRFVLALAESTAEEAQEALRRVNALLRERLGLDARAGLARFPDDALTLDDLVTRAAERARTADVVRLVTAPGPPADIEVPSTNGHGPETGAVRDIVASARALAAGGE